MQQQLEARKERYEELNMLLADPAVLKDADRYQKLVREHAELKGIVTDYQAFLKVRQQLAENEELLQQSDEPEFSLLVKDELVSLREQEKKLQKKLRQALVPKDPNDERDVIVEIRAGTGGDEAALFAEKLFRMYAAYSQQQGWQIETVEVSETELGGFKEIVFMVQGTGAYSQLKFESGVHRVQRVPVTESSGRIHTSAVSVAVMPEAEEVEVNLDPGDLLIDTYRASGAGGQHVNRTDSAIRITHRPTGIVVTCQDQRSQLKNKERALRVLRSRLLEKQRSEAAAAIASDRKSMVGSGDRSERIRTYNYHQGRVTDHRIGLTLYRLEEILQGDLATIVQALQLAQQGEEGEASERDGF